MSSLNLLVLLLIATQCFSQDAPKVQTFSGKIKGHYLISYLGNRYEAYEGIPYALPPILNRRFQPPEPVDFWPNELVADRKPSSCLQLNSYKVIGDEDCLYLNIYAPIRKTNKTLPVIFYLHPGAFIYGAGTRFGPKYLIDYDVILVTINYRLGVLGFLSTEDEIISGNMGLKDQSTALHWISKNIQYFGGDSSKITLFGLSAGGASVQYHYLSPMSTGLFHSGISFSGTAFNCWSQTENSRGKALELAKMMNCTVNDVKEMIECLRQCPGKALVNAQIQFMPWLQNPFTPFGPVVEKFSKKPFIDRSPIEIINSGGAQDLPWITGVTSEEGLYSVAGLTEEMLKELNDNWESIAPHLLDYFFTIPKENHAKVARKIREHYFGNKTINKQNLFILTNLVSDRLFIVDAEKAAMAMAKMNSNPVWFYYYSYRANQSVSNGFSNSTENLGVCHGDDVNMVLENYRINPTTTESDYAMHKDLVKYWTSVAQEGVPRFGPEWHKVSNKSSLDYLQILGPGKFEAKTDINLAQRLFWDSINFNENKIDPH